MAEPPPACHRRRVALFGDAAHTMPPALGQGGNQAGSTAARPPRTAAIARKAVRVARPDMARGRAAVAARDSTAIAVLSKAGPALLPRGFDDIADRGPPYASGQTRTDKR